VAGVTLPDQTHDRVLGAAVQARGVLRRAVALR
jgi:hypothetical protein